MKRFALVAIAVLLALVGMTVTALAMEAGPADIMPMAPNQTNPRLAVAHLAPFAPDPGTAVTVTLDSAPVLTNVEFADSTGYITVTTGTHLVEIWPAGSASPAITGSVTFTEDTDYSAIAIGDGSNQPLDLLLLEDDNTPPAAGNAHVRIGHLAPFASAITDTVADVRLQDGTVLLDDVPFGAVAPYTPLPAGTYDLKITNADGSATLIDLYPVTLAEGDILSIFAVGDGANQPVGAFVWPSGAAGALAPLAANLQVAHLAPFAADPGTVVTVTVDSTPLLTDFEFADSTGYVPLEAGVDHLIEIFPAGSADPAISATVNLTHAMDFSAIAIGNIVNQPLDLLLLEDDNTPPAAGNAHVRIGHLAPFASAITDTVADVLVNGAVFLDDVPYRAVTGYTELVPADYELKLTPGDGTLSLFGPVSLMLQNGDIASVFAVGDVTNQPVGIFVWPSGEAGFLVKYKLYLPLVMKNSTGTVVLP